MGISSDAWVSTVTEAWYGSSMSPDQFQQMWQTFLSSPDVKYLPANATPEEIHALYLQFIAHQISSVDPWFAQIAQEVLGPLSDADVQQILQSFLALPQVVSMRQPASQDAYHTLFGQYLSSIVLSQNSWYQNATQAVYGPMTQDNLETLVLSFVMSPAVGALPPSATAADYQQLYMQFLSSALQQAHQIEQATAVSPEAVAQGKILMSIFELLAKMTEQTSIAQITDGQVINYLTQKQEQYAQMLANVPLYVGGGIADLGLNATLKTLGLTTNVSVTNPNVPSSTFDNVQSPDIGLQFWWNMVTYGQSPPPNGLPPFDGTLTPAPGTNVPIVQLVSQMIAEQATTLDCGTVSGGAYNGTHMLLILTPPATGSGTYTFTAELSGGGQPYILKKETFTLTSSTTVEDRPILISNADSVYTPISPSTDPAKFYLGYGNISLQQISQSLASEFATAPAATSLSPQTASFSMSSGAWNDNGTYYSNTMYLVVTQAVGGQLTVSTFLNQQSTQDPVRNSDQSIDWIATHDKFLSGGGGSYSSTNLVRVDTPLTDSGQSTIVNALNTTFQSVWNQATAQGLIGVTDPSQLSAWVQQQGTSGNYANYVMNAMTPRIPWPAGSLASWFQPGQTPTPFQSKTLTGYQQPATAQRNQLENTYLSTIHSRMDVLGNFISQQQQVVNASSQGLTSTSNIINSTLQELVQILNSVFT